MDSGCRVKSLRFTIWRFGSSGIRCRVQGSACGKCSLSMLFQRTWPLWFCIVTGNLMTTNSASKNTSPLETSAPRRAHPSRSGAIRPEAGLYVPRRADLSRRGSIRPEALLSVPRRGSPSRGEVIRPEAGLSVPRRGYVLGRALTRRSCKCSGTCSARTRT